MSDTLRAGDGAEPRVFDDHLEALRHRVDTIDTQLLGLLNARAAVVADIYALKQRQGVARLDRARTGAILDRLAAASAGPLDASDVRALFAPILKYFVERYSPPVDIAKSADAASN
jgi:3-deoxy-7-phosphoheptulonate synthase/chorismate mutase